MLSHQITAAVRAQVVWLSCRFASRGEEASPRELTLVPKGAWARKGRPTAWQKGNDMVTVKNGWVYVKSDMPEINLFTNAIFNIEHVAKMSETRINLNGSRSYRSVTAVEIQFDSDMAHVGSSIFVTKDDAREIAAILMGDDVARQFVDAMRE